MKPNQFFAITYYFLPIIINKPCLYPLMLNSVVTRLFPSNGFVFASLHFIEKFISLYPSKWNLIIFLVDLSVILMCYSIQSLHFFPIKFRLVIIMFLKDFN
jgi:hypothetical protein